MELFNGAPFPSRKEIGNSPAWVDLRKDYTSILPRSFYLATQV